jgi:hypothetical protein
MVYSLPKNTVRITVLLVCMFRTAMMSSFFEYKKGLKQGDSLSPILFNLLLQKVIQSIKMVPSGIKIGKNN